MNQTPNSPQMNVQQPQNDDLLALIRAVALMGKRRRQIALVTLVFTIGGG